MTLNQGHRRLFVLLVCAVTIFSGCHKSDRAQQSVPATDAKAEIYKFLAKKSGQKEFAPGIDLDLPKQVTTLRSNANILEQRTVALRASLRAADEEQAPLRKEGEALRNELANVKREAGEARLRLKEAEARVPADANEIAARQREYVAREGAWTAKRQELSANGPQFEARFTERRQKRSAIEQELQQAERAWEAARGEASRKQGELSRQENAYIGATRQQVSGVRSYEALYRLIGQQLATADRLLADPDISRRRIGLSFAREACGHANAEPEDVWLAARICEAYLWPNLDLADSAPGSRERALDLLQTCRRIFSAGNETNNVLKNYSLLMTNASDSRTADTYRVQLADWLEESGNLKRAAEVLSEIRDADVLSSAQERITRVKERIAAAP